MEPSQAGLIARFNSLLLGALVRRSRTSLLEQLRARNVPQIFFRWAGWRDEV